MTNILFVHKVRVGVNISSFTSWLHSVYGYDKGSFQHEKWYNTPARKKLNFQSLALSVQNLDDLKNQGRERVKLTLVVSNWNAKTKALNPKKSIHPFGVESWNAGHIAGFLPLWCV
jgi:hypothetical protein